jgi:hypothetical protein
MEELLTADKRKRATFAQDLAIGEFRQKRQCTKEERGALSGSLGCDGDPGPSASTFLSICPTTQTPIVVFPVPSLGPRFENPKIDSQSVQGLMGISPHLLFPVSLSVSIFGS